MKFIDLFAGLGGFNLALRGLGHECVFACELDHGLRELYERNFRMECAGDIRQVRVSEIPEHDVLCAGFPCQPFSKAGSQQGFSDPRWGDLFGFVLRVVESHKPSFVLLENVPHLENHRSGHTWRELYEALAASGYDVAQERLSPHQFGVPQIRDRLFIVGSRLEGGLWGFEWPERETTTADLSITSILDKNPPDSRPISDQVRRCLGVWQEFLDGFPVDEELPSFPIWSMEFGATYPYKDGTPFAAGVDALRSLRGSHGRSLGGLSNDDVWKALPSHARSQEPTFPRWKVAFIRQNRELYARNESWIESWLPGILEFPSSLQKLEWNCKGEPRDIWRYVIQCRPSGVRVKRPTTAPSLVAMTTTQVPIIAWEARYLTPRECARLQSMDDLELPAVPTKAFEALGNAVNVRLVRLIAERLLAGGVEAEELRDVV